MIATALKLTQYYWHLPGVPSIHFYQLHCFNNIDRVINSIYCTYHGEEAGDKPDYEGRVDGSGVEEDAGGRHEDAGADDGAHDHSDPVEERHLSLELHATARGLSDRAVVARHLQSKVLWLV